MKAAKQTTLAKISDDIIKQNKHRIAQRRQLLRTVLKVAEERTAALPIRNRQDDKFISYYGTSESVKIIQPPYDPEKLYEIMEESGPLSACVAAYTHNISGCEFKIVPVKDVEGNEETVDKNERALLQGFFDAPNASESFRSINQNLRRDYEATGNAYLEVTRNNSTKPHTIYWLDTKKTRLLPLDIEPCIVKTTIIRNGKEIEDSYSKFFRRFVVGFTDALSGKLKLRYYKEYGDPRNVNARTGTYYVTIPKTKEELAQADKSVGFELATEVIHFKFGTGVYGIPRWLGQLMAAKGVTSADFVNYDLFDSQGIPPMIMSIAGGQLTDDSFKDLQTMLSKAKGAANFNKFLLMEIESLSDHIDMSGKEPIPRVDIKSMTDYRKEDAMFTVYTKQSSAAIRENGFRLPSLFVGDSGSFNYATARVAREVTEEQVFAPERDIFDDTINHTIVKNLGVKTVRFKSGVPVYTNTADLISNLEPLAKNGAFTVNELIGIANQFFGTNLQPYTDLGEEWADIPITFLLNPLNDPTGTMPKIMPGIQGLMGSNSTDGIVRNQTTGGGKTKKLPVKTVVPPKAK